LNLSVNARDAMPRGGALTIRTDNVELGREQSMAHPDLQPGSYVMLEVTDSGTGMPPEVKNRIFEPYFTTKEAGIGTGLGLAIVLGVVKQSNGFIEARSEPGAGTTFKIFLPRAEAFPQVEDDFPDLEHAPKGTETVLLVEDEDAVRALLSNVLQECGYTVLEAGGVEDAIRVAAGYAARIHLLVTDVVMPGKGGGILAEKLTAQYPKLKVLYVSGYTDESVGRHGIVREKVDFLQKPFSPLILAHKVREILSRQPVAAVAPEPDLSIAKT
jgi:two-component system, cell cycle sensor histidine kinase and response regulator CckA